MTTTRSENIIARLRSCSATSRHAPLSLTALLIASMAPSWLLRSSEFVGSSRT